VRHTPFLRNVAALVQAARDDGIEHLHSSLMLAAHQAAHAAARQLQTPFTLTAYSGHDTFVTPMSAAYRGIAADPLCETVIVEDVFMRDWAVNRLGIPPDKIALIANSFDLALYRLPAPRPARDSVVILAIARFVEKKGLIYLVQAFQRLSASVNNVELWLVGNGPEEARLRQAVGHHPRVKFLGAISETQTRQAYSDADIFCLPCIQTAQGDADGVPTTVLEAMAFELPIVSSHLLSLPYYVRHEEEGLLTAPGNVEAIAAALARLCQDRELRERLGRTGRVRVVELCDLTRNIEQFQTILHTSRTRRWQVSLDALLAWRRQYTPEREAYYTACRTRAAAYFQPHGRLLDIGCGHGKMRLPLPPDVTYVGCDPVPLDETQRDFEFHVACAEVLPFPGASFDAALLYAVLPNVLSIDAVLAEAARVLKPGGHVYLHECVDDPNPIHLNHLSTRGLLHCLEEHFQVVDTRPAGEQLLMVKARKPGPAVSTPVAEMPLVSVAITTYNRATCIRTCIDSVLHQTYHPLDVVVYDDGSTDDTRRMLESYGSAIRIAYGEQNRGIAFAKNCALEMTAKSARYVAILDSDDYFHPRFVERCVAALEQMPEIGLVYTDDILVDIAGREIRCQAAVEPWNVETWLRTCNLRGDTWLARRTLVMRTALHDETLLFDVDYDLFYQLLELTTFAHVPEFLVYIREHHGRSTHNQYALAKCHAANLVKYGYASEYAYLRARHHPKWVPAIEEGIALGKQLYAKRTAKVGEMVGQQR
jgi:glycosyltransferase involved in cell wall biosynthesis